MKLSKEDLNKRAQAFMEAKGCDCVVMTEDGNVFMMDKKHFAEAHAKTQKCEVVEIKKAKAEAKTEKKSKGKSKSE